jgi:hypothetical protein
VSEQKQLPAGLKRASMVAMVAGALMGILSAHSMAQVLEPIDYDALAKEQPPPVVAGPQALAKLPPVFLKSYGRNLEAMKGSRVAILMLLSVAASLLFVSSLRMLRPLGVPREGVRRLLGGAALACALFSTLDGAQSTAAARRASAAVDRVAVEEAIADWLPGMFGAFAVLIWAGFTLIIAGSFTGLWMYFKSERVQEQLQKLEDGSS